MHTAANHLRNQPSGAKCGGGKPAALHLQGGLGTTVLTCCNGRATFVEPYPSSYRKRALWEAAILSVLGPARVAASVEMSTMITFAANNEFFRKRKRN